MAVVPHRRSLLSSQARVQVPWVNVTLGKYTFGVRNKRHASMQKNADGFYVKGVNTKYFPDFITGMSVKKINGRVNTYTLNISYPVTQFDDPNFFEKVLSSISKTRQIAFSYGDATQPNYVYKDQTAIITKVTSSFNLQGSSIQYTITAVSNGILAESGSYTFEKRKGKPSQIIKQMFLNTTYGLQALFTGMGPDNLDLLIAGDDAEVEIHAKANVSALQYITYLASCMLPAGSTKVDISKDIYILTVHDQSVYDTLYNDNQAHGGPYFKITKTGYGQEHSDAYVVDVGYNTSTIVTNFQVDKNENYSIFYDYQAQLTQEKYVKKLNQKGQWEQVYMPPSTSFNQHYETRAEDISWWTKITRFPITASITIQGLLRPAHLLTYLRLNVIFPGGKKHIASGLYIVTQQLDQVDQQGYRTTLQLTKIQGQEDLSLGDTRL